MASPEERSAQQWAAIIALLQAQVGAGKMLPTVADVRASIDLWTGNVPAVGVQLQSVRADQVYTKGVKSTAEFVILAATRSVPDIISPTQTTPPNLDDAMSQVQAIVNDGNGNGITQILRLRANQTLGGLCSTVLITGVDYSWEIDRGATGSDQVWAYALIKFSVIDFLNTSI